MRNFFGSLLVFSGLVGAGKIFVVVVPVAPAVCINTHVQQQVESYQSNRLTVSWETEYLSLKIAIWPIANHLTHKKFCYHTLYICRFLPDLLRRDLQIG